MLFKNIFGRVVPTLQKRSYSFIPPIIPPPFVPPPVFCGSGPSLSPWHSAIAIGCGIIGAGIGAYKSVQYVENYDKLPTYQEENRNSDIMFEVFFNIVIHTGIGFLTGVAFPIGIPMSVYVMYKNQKAKKPKLED